MILSLSELATRTGGKAVGPTELAITGFATDSRQVQPGDLFLAIRGANVDGAAFWPNAQQLGAVAALTETPVDGPHILVTSVPEALANLGRSYRAEYIGPVVGITGSAGKTTTREFTAAALSVLGPVVSTVGNRNTEYTSPLIWPEVTPETAAVVTEMGMRGFGQIAHLAGIHQPRFGVITNIGFAHLAMVGSREGIARAKSELIDALPANGTAFFWSEDQYLPILREHAGNRTVILFGEGPDADCRIISVEPQDWDRSLVRGFYIDIPWSAEIPVIGRHFALNAAAAVAVACRLGIAPQEAADQLWKAVLPPLRMETREIDGATWVLDTYNSSPPSLKATLETLGVMQTPGRRIAVLGEMRELGDTSAELHREIGEFLGTQSLDEVVFVAEGMRDAQAVYGRDSRWFATTDDAREYVQNLVQPGDLVLVKGSRAVELERLVP